MTKYSQQYFVPKNPQKIVGNARPFSRSSWELRIMSFLDSHPNVIQWGSECIRIPYVNPLTGKGTVYVPDFLIRYRDKNGNELTELVEDLQYQICMPLEMAEEERAEEIRVLERRLAELKAQ